MFERLAKIRTFELRLTPPRETVYSETCHANGNRPEGREARRGPALACHWFPSRDGRGLECRWEPGSGEDRPPANQRGQLPPLVAPPLAPFSDELSVLDRVAG